MLKCKDCLHYEVCRKWYILTGHSAKEADEISELEYEYEGNFCTYSKDKSLIAELPCRVGEDVYVNILSPIKMTLEMEVTGFKIGVMYDEDVDDSENSEKSLEELCIQVRDSLRSFSIPLSLLNKTIFLTHDEAVRALKEREKNG